MTQNLDILVDGDMVQFDQDAPILWMPKAIKYNAPRSPDNVTAWESDWRKLPDCEIKARAWHVLKAHCDYRDTETKPPKKLTKRNSFVMAFTYGLEKPITQLDLRSNHRSETIGSTLGRTIGSTLGQGPKVGPIEKEKEKEIEIDAGGEPPAEAGSIR